MWVNGPVLWSLWEQAEHLPQGMKPLSVGPVADGMEDLTKMSLRFLGLRKEVIGTSGMADLHRLDEWRTGIYVCRILQEDDGSQRQQPRVFCHGQQLM